MTSSKLTPRTPKIYFIRPRRGIYETVYDIVNEEMDVVRSGIHGLRNADHIRSIIQGKENLLAADGLTDDDVDF